MRRVGLALMILLFGTIAVEAGGFRAKRAKSEAVPPQPGVVDPGRLVTPNGVVVPKWASRQIANSPAPLFGKSWGRRPWAMALNTSTTTPAAYWARVDQLGFGAGPVPGFTNGPPLGNIPSMPMGPDGGPLGRQGFQLGVVPRIPFAYYFD